MHFKNPERQLALFEECSVIQNRTEREACCDKKVESAGGRDFCYNEITHDEDKFK